MKPILTQVKEAAIPAVVGAVMLMATWGIIHSVRQEILTIAAAAAKEAVQSTLGAIKPAVDWKGINVITPVVHIGDPLIVDYIARVNKQCPADLRAFLINTNGTAVYRFPDTQGGYRQADPNKDQTIRVAVDIDDPPAGDQFAPLKPGVYIYRVTAIRYCETIQLDSFVPDVTFTLVR